MNYKHFRRANNTAVYKRHQLKKQIDDLIYPVGIYMLPIFDRSFLFLQIGMSIHEQKVDENEKVKQYKSFKH